MKETQTGEEQIKHLARLTTKSNHQRAKFSHLPMNCRLQVLVSVAPGGFSILHGASDMSYILPELLLRVTQKPKSHLKTVNEFILVTATPGEEADHWAGRGQRAG